MSSTILESLSHVLLSLFALSGWMIVIKYSKENKNLKKELEDLKKELKK